MACQPDSPQLCPHPRSPPFCTSQGRGPDHTFFLALVPPSCCFPLLKGFPFLHHLLIHTLPICGGHLSPRDTSLPPVPTFGISPTFPTPHCEGRNWKTRMSRLLCHVLYVRCPHENWVGGVVPLRGTTGRYQRHLVPGCGKVELLVSSAEGPRCRAALGSSRWNSLGGWHVMANGFRVWLSWTCCGLSKSLE